MLAGASVQTMAGVMIGTSLARIVKDIPLFGHALSWGFLGVFGFWSIGFYFHFRKNESALFDFGRWHASPQARTWDAFSWTTYKHGCSRSGSFFHFVLVAVVPLFAALTADFPSLSKGDGSSLLFGIRLGYWSVD